MGVSGTKEGRRARLGWVGLGGGGLSQTAAPLQKGSADLEFRARLDSKGSTASQCLLFFLLGGEEVREDRAAATAAAALPRVQVQCRRRK